MESQPNLDDLALLCAVVDRGSFRAAADYAGTSQPTVSRAITRLETRLGRALVRRNSRSVVPTALGLAYADRARRLLREFAEVEAELLSSEALAGPIALSAPPAVGRTLLVPVLAAFKEAYPGVRLDLSLENRRVDLLQESVDVAVRFGPLAPTWRRQRLVLRGHYHLYGAQAFARELAGREPEHILERAPCLVLHSTHLRDRWPFLDRAAGGQRWLSVKPELTCDDVGALIAFASQGAGVTLMPDFLVRRQLEQGTLVQLTSPQDALPAEVFAVTVERAQNERVRALVAYMAEHLLD